MPSVNEAAAAPGQMAAGLAEGVDLISQSQTITFTQYSQYVLPIDGYVFWVNTGSANSYPGSLHQHIDQRQNEDETIDINQIVFTSLNPVDAFNSIAPTTLLIGEFEGARFAFSRRGHYRQAGLYHYVGEAVYPALSSQLIDDPSTIPVSPVVSNSLPIWLSQNSFAPVYPSFLVPANVEPPYITAHIEPSQTEAPTFPHYVWPGVEVPDSGASPFYDLASSQLALDRVRLTLYGFNNQTAIQYFVSLIEYSLSSDAFGFKNSPVPRDEKRTQTEMAVIAMKKVIDIEAWYYQGTVDAIARRLILKAGFSSITTS